MSFIVKGIDLPEDAGSLDLVVYDKKGNYLTDYEILLTEAIQIPTPHGRIVDIDKVKDELRDQIPYCGLDMTYSNSNAFDTMDNAPTILEAED